MRRSTQATTIEVLALILAIGLPRWALAQMPPATGEMQLRQPAAQSTIFSPEPVDRRPIYVGLPIPQATHSGEVTITPNVQRNPPGGAQNPSNPNFPAAAPLVKPLPAEYSGNRTGAAQQTARYREPGHAHVRDSVVGSDAWISGRGRWSRARCRLVVDCVARVDCLVDGDHRARLAERAVRGDH